MRLLSFCLLFLGGCAEARAQDAGAICSSVNSQIEDSLLQNYTNSVMEAHGQYPFARGLKNDLQKQAKAFMDQRLLDQRAELCAIKLQLAERIKSSGSAGCARSAEFLGPYMQKAAQVYDNNKKTIQALHDESVKALKKKLFEIATGSTSGLEGITYKGQPLLGAAREVKYEWLKEVAGQLGGEVHRAWGIFEAEKNPLMQLNADFAREAIEAKKEADAAKRAGPCKTAAPAS